MRILKQYKFVLSVLGLNPLHGFFFRTLSLQGSEHYSKFGFNPFNYYEFGTGEGNSLKTYIKALKDYCKETRNPLEQYNIFAFDSFEGLPKYQNKEDYNPAWKKGQLCGLHICSFSVHCGVQLYGMVDHCYPGSPDGANASPGT